MEGGDDDLTLGFDRLDRSDVVWAGGKGANLGELEVAGFPVPRGFVVGAPAYRRFREETGLAPRLIHRLEGLDLEDTAALSDAAEGCQQMIRSRASSRLAHSACRS